MLIVIEVGSCFSTINDGLMRKDGIECHILGDRRNLSSSGVEFFRRFGDRAGNGSRSPPHKQFAGGRTGLGCRRQSRDLLIQVNRINLNDRAVHRPGDTEFRFLGLRRVPIFPSVADTRHKLLIRGCHEVTHIDRFTGITTPYILCEERIVDERIAVVLEVGHRVHTAYLFDGDRVLAVPTSCSQGWNSR